MCATLYSHQQRAQLQAPCTRRAKTLTCEAPVLYCALAVLFFAGTNAASGAFRSLKAQRTYVTPVLIRAWHLKLVALRERSGMHREVHVRLAHSETDGGSLRVRVPRTATVADLKAQVPQLVSAWPRPCLERSYMLMYT